MLYNKSMYELYPYFTNDGSVGLFSPDADDIYHSTYGALTEAYEKFILPSDFKKYFQKNNEIKILDICFGIGYNTKSFLNNFYENIYNESIGVDNVNYNDELYSNNKKYKIFIKAVDTDKILANLSPFFITNKNNAKNSKLPFKQDKISKMLSGVTQQKYKLKKEIQILLLKNIFENIDFETENILYNKKYLQYFDPSIMRLFKFYKSQVSNLPFILCLNRFLHNIYYKNISMSHKSLSKALKLIDFTFDLNIDDARKVLLNDNVKYNYVFLDAFTPTKCPCLWTLDFMKLLYSHLEAGGMILTYSNSAQVRNAFLNAGFYVGKIYSESSKKFTGTVASNSRTMFEENNLIYELSEYDLGLMKTKAGIFYRDENFNLDNEAIINLHKLEVEKSKLISSSRFIKEYKKLDK